MTTRRDFLKKSVALTTAGLFMPSLLTGNRLQAQTIGANDRINVALIGCKNMGWNNLSDFLLHPEVDCVALCDIDRSILEKTAREVEKIRTKTPQLCTDYHTLLDQQDIDAVIIATPDHWHCLQMVDACAAGKDVYVEKPLANTIAECDVMVAAARMYRRVVQVGQQQRSGNHWREMKSYLDSGRLGKIAKVNIWANFGYAWIPSPVADSPVPPGVDFDAWLGPAPRRAFNEKRFHGLWRMFWDYGGGLITDWGVHLIDMALWGMNVADMPKRVFGSGGNFAHPDNYAETFETLSVIYEYDNFIIQWNNTSTETGPYGKWYGVEFVGTNGTLVANREGWEVYPVANKIEPVKSMPDYRDHQNHVSDFLDAMKTRRMDTACTVDNGSLCAKYAHFGNISARVGAPLVYDDVKKKFDHVEASQMIKPDYRKPWKFPELSL